MKHGKHKGHKHKGHKHKGYKYKGAGSGADPCKVVLI